MSGEVELLVKAINGLGNITLLDILTLIANIIIGVSAIGSLLLSRESLKQVKIESQNSQDFQFALKKQDIEQWVLREDIFVTVIPVFSYYDICLQNLKDRLMELARKEASEINL